MDNTPLTPEDVRWRACLAAVEALRSALTDTPGARLGNSRSPATVDGETTTCVFTVYNDSTDRFTITIVGPS